MKELISFWIANEYELGFVVAWLTYGICLGFKNWLSWTYCVVFLLIFKPGFRFSQNATGKVLDALFLVSGIAFVLYKNHVFSF